jgi:hypothetical protein
MSVSFYFWLSSLLTLLISVFFSASLHYTEDFAWPARIFASKCARRQCGTARTLHRQATVQSAREYDMCWQNFASITNHFLYDPTSSISSGLYPLHGIQSELLGPWCRSVPAPLTTIFPLGPTCSRVPHLSARLTQTTAECFWSGSLETLDMRP